MSNGPTTGVSMLAQHPAMEGAGMDPEAFSHQVAKAGRVQVGAAANHTVLGQATQLPGDISQHVDCAGCVKIRDHCNAHVNTRMHSSIFSIWHAQRGFLLINLHKITCPKLLNVDIKNLGWYV